VISTALDHPVLGLRLIEPVEITRATGVVSTELDQPEGVAG
jgi:hypothetical protein